MTRIQVPRVGRRLARSCTLALAALVGMAQAFAQDFPNRPITFVVPVTAGGPSDIMTRAIAQKLQVELKAPVVVENRTGAAGVIGLKYVLSQKPDGYTYVMAGSNVLAALPHLDPGIGYDVDRDIQPISLVSKTALILFQTKQLPSQTLKQMVDWGKQHPGQLSFASAGPASTAHMSGEFLSLLTGLQMTHVPYRGSSAAVPDLIAGRVQLFFDAAQTMSFVKEGQLRALAINSPQRMPAFPDVPTFAEAGLPDFTLQLWFALVGAKGIPQQVVDRMSQALRKVLADPELVSTFARQGVELQWSSPAQLAAYTREQSERMKQLITSRNIKMN